jgi:hypothetical protein
MGVVRFSFLNSSIKPKVSTAPSSPLKKRKKKKNEVCSYINTGTYVTLLAHLDIFL